MKKIFIFFAVLLPALVLLGGCGGGTGSGAAVEIVDCAGRTVAIPAEPKAIATLDPLAGQAVIMYGCGDIMKATVGGVKRDELLVAICPALADCEVAKEEGSVNAETLLELGIDLIFLKSDMYAKPDTRKKLDSIRIPYIVIEYNSMERQREAMKIIGTALGCEEEAALYEEYYEKLADEAAEGVAKIAEADRPSLYHACNEALKTDSLYCLGADWISLTGVRNVSTNAEDLLFNEKNYYTTLEQIYQWDPDIIICNETGVDDYIMASNKWAGLRAVKAGRVYQVPIGVSRWGHENSTETPLAVIWLAKTLYPEQFADIDLYEEMKYYYSTFYEYEINADLAEKILSGDGIRPAAN